MSPDPRPDSPDTPPEDTPPKRFRSPFAIRPRTLVIVGLLALAGGIFGLRDHIGFLISAEQAEAHVVSVETFDPTEGFTLYRPTIRYLTANGGMTATAADTYRPTEAGEILSVAYDPANPADARLMDPRDRWILPLWMVVFGAITIVIGIRRARRGPSLDSD
ncbi:DUF3592 domain-containing protein [Thalassobaculum sp.]|uniref:DUF3592 domain-containing protein n=1 Tax=Thalassobaculum sp. TaxID=2022740 RepID=UPI003B59B99C